MFVRSENDDAFGLAHSGRRAFLLQFSEHTHEKMNPVMKSNGEPKRSKRFVK